MNRAQEPDGLQLDLACIVARLQQVIDEGGFATANPIVVERILTCDLPRLKGHLTAESTELLCELFESEDP